MFGSSLSRFQKIIIVFLIIQAQETNAMSECRYAKIMPAQNISENLFSSLWKYFFRVWDYLLADLRSRLHYLMNLAVECIVDIVPDAILEMIGMHLYSCDDYNRTSFDIVIRQELFGQLMFDLNVPRILDDFFHKDLQKETLLMSFHGPPGSGKSHAAKIIAENLFQDLETECVHLFYGIRDFYDYNEKQNYRKKLVTDVRRVLYKCDKQLFIFDDMDNMIPGVIDALKPYIFSENKPALNGKSIFLFLGNSGAEKINGIAFDAWLDFIPRDNLVLEMFTPHLKEAAYKERGALQYSDVVKENLIDVYIPFLPMEKEQVIECIDKRRKLFKKPYNIELMKKIAETFEYYPEQFQIFSRSGCKRVLFKVGLYFNN